MFGRCARICAARIPSGAAWPALRGVPGHARWASNGAADHIVSFSVRKGRSLAAVLRRVKNYSRCKGVVKRLPLIMQREERHEQAAYRNRWHREFIYWRKWAYLKYAVEHIKYALKHKKPLAL